MVAVLPVLGEPAAAVELSERAPDDPALGFDDEAFGVISAFDDLDCQVAHRWASAILEGGAAAARRLWQVQAVVIATTFA